MGAAPHYDTNRYLAMDKWQAVRCAAHLELLNDVAKMDQAEDWTFDRANSMSHWLVNRYGLSHRTASEWTRVAHAIQELPAIRAAYQAGRMSWDQVRTATRLATAETDAEIAAEAPFLTVRELSQRVRQIELRDVQEVHRTRHFTFKFDEENPVLWLSGKMVASDGVEFVKALPRLANKAPAQTGGTYEPLEARCLDALIMLASQARGADRDPDRATAIVRVPRSVLADGESDAHFEDGTPIMAETARKLVCDGRLQIWVEDGEQSVLGVGRTKRNIPPWLARLLRTRDHGCRYPGCGRTRWVHFHHLIHWAHGGPTDLDNLVSLCPFHHRLVRDDGWRISGDPNDEVVWIRPGGSPYVPGWRDEYAAAHPISMVDDAMVPDHRKSPETDDTS